MKHVPVGIATDEKRLAEYYATGFAFCLFGQAKADFERDAKALWPTVRDSFLQTWITEHPGERPWIWWELDAPERRRRIGTLKNDKVIRDRKPHPFENKERIAEIDEIAAEGAYPGFLEHVYNLSFGKPSVYFVADDWFAAFEDEFDYLDRLGLLLPGEREQVWE